MVAAQGPSPRRSVGDALCRLSRPALPDDPAARCREADSRFRQRFLAATARDHDPSIVYPNLYGTMFTPDQIAADVLAFEDELLAQAM